MPDSNANWDHFHSSHTWHTEETITAYNMNNIEISIQNADSKIEELRQDICDDYNSQITYQVGDYCMVGGLIYRCISETNTEPSENNHAWLQIKILNDIKDVNQTIETKLNKPSNDGTSGQVLQTNGDGTTSWVNYSGGGGSGGNSAIIDSTLTQQGQAADAKAAGDRIGTLETGITEKVNKPSGNGSYGQVLQTNGDGTTSWVNQTSGSSVTIDSTLTQQGQAADAKAAGDRISALETGIASKMNKPSGNGTSGQFLKTNGDGTTTWATVSGGGSVIIDDTLSIADVAADAKATGDALAAKAPAIIDEKYSYSFEDTDFITFVGNTHAWGNARYANKKNLIRLSESSGVIGGGGVNYHVYENNIAELNGTSTNTGDIGITTLEGLNIPAGTYKFKIEVHPGTSVLNGTKNLYCDFFYEGATTYSVRGQLSAGLSDVSTNITAAEKVVKIRVWLGAKKDSVYTDYRLFYSLLPSDAIVTDTQETVSPTETLDYDFPSTMDEVDTLMHQGVTMSVIDTKTYVDTRTPDVDFICLRPEDYGAYGDGTHDDSVALQACINAAQASESKAIPVRGYGKYTISTGISIHGRELDIFINRIDYTGNDAAITISASYSKFFFGSLRAIQSGNNDAIGIKLVALAATDTPYNGYYNNILHCPYLYTNSHTISFVDLGNGANNFYYNEFYFKYQRSKYGNLLYVSHGCRTNEIDIYGKIGLCPNGYVLYEDHGNSTDYGSEGAGASWRFHEYSFENGIKNGIYGYAILINCRTAELMNQKSRTDLTTGNLFTFDGIPAGGRCIGACAVDMTAIDVTNALSFDGVLNAIKTAFENDPSASTWKEFNRHLGISGNNGQFLEIENCVRAANANLAPGDSMTLCPTGSIIVYYNNIAFKPKEDVYQLVSDDMTIQLTSENGYKYLTPTIFDINASSVDIHLDVSYCCIAINKFDVIQYSGKTAKVYDKNGTLIFDGTNRGAGVFHFSCSMVPLTNLTVTLSNSTVKQMPQSLLPTVYTGSNEIWTITKEEIVSEYAHTITNILTRCRNDSSMAVITDGSAYNATIIANTGYTMETVTVTMGGTDITSTAYDSTTGAISIANVTGNIMITATAVTSVS